MAGELIEIIGKQKTISALVMYLETNSVAVGDTILGRVINALGEPIDGGPTLDKSLTRPVIQIFPPK